jgi:alkanesulfonate monooxygenase SsuD/methylene tetrahydromethanopterin reductase-like flavin-dependent oxidoreductase (luciferase family)
MQRLQNPILGPNKFKLGLFNSNCDGGFAISKAPERWRCEWDDVVKASVMADEAGIDFILPVAKWRGLGGEADNLGRSFETMTHSAAIGAVTKRIGLFATIHVPIVTPAFAAKAIATIDHVTHGRVGLNIVCGWNQDEFNVHGATIDPEHRYDQGLEWYRIFAKLLEGGPLFDWEGQFYKLRGLTTNPLTVQRPLPPIMSAGLSPKGRDFAAQTADLLFTSVSNIERALAIVKSVQDFAARYGRRIAVYTTCHIVCRPTRQEAEDFYYYYAEEMADRASLEYIVRQKEATAGSDTSKAERPDTNPQANSRKRGKIYPGTFPGCYTIVGKPDDVADEMIEMSLAGLAGASICFLDYLAAMPYFIQEVLPRLERAGLRQRNAVGSPVAADGVTTAMLG